MLHTRFDVLRARRLVMAGCALSCLIAAGQARAEAAGGAAAGAQAQDQALSSGSQRGVAEVKEVVVTANKRGAQSLQKVPEAITAQTQETLQNEGAIEFADYARSVPSLSAVDEGPGQKTYIIRGVNSVGTGVATVGQYVDEMLITGDLNQPDLRLYDVQRVEVLRGPQGTLYGASSLSGTIRTVTNQPNLGAYSFDFLGRYSGTEHGGGNYETAGTLNAPIIEDKLALRATAYEDEESGFINNVRLGTKDVNAEHTYGARGTLLWKIDNQTSLTLNGIFQNTNTDGRDIITTTGAQSGKYDTDQWVHDPFTDHFYIANATLKRDFGFGEFVLSSSYFDRSVDNKFDSTPFDLSFGPNFFTDVVGLSTYRGLTDQLATSKILTNEARFSTKFGGRFEGVVGVFQQQLNTTFNTIVATSNVQGYLNRPLEPIFGQNSAHETDQYAVFGEFTYKITDKLTALVGARAFYARETDNLDSTYQFGGFAPPFNSPTIKSNAQKVTPKFNLAYQADRDHMFYATISEGFRIGGGNQSDITPLPPQDLTYRPDWIWNYEAGAKMAFLGRRLLVNGSVYKMNWTNIQVSDFTDDSNALEYVANAGSARVYGAELEVQARPTRALSLGATLAYADARLTENQPATNPTYAAHKGDFFPNVPAWSGSAYVQYQRPLSDGLDLLARADYSYTGAQRTQFSPQNPIYNAIPAYDILNLRIGVKTEKKWEVAVYVRNALDNYAAVNIIEQASNLTPRAIVPLRPRTMGVELGYHF